jgi:hypothetical protein
MMPTPPAIPASLAAIVMLAGLGLIYWSLVGFGVLQTSPGAITSAAALPATTGAAIAGGGGNPARRT